jgi:hypothetical protein
MLDALFSWPGVSRRALSWLLPESAPRSARVLDVRFLRTLRALGHTVATVDRPAQLLCARAPDKAADLELIELLRGYASQLVVGGIVILRSPAKGRERIAAAFLHAGLRDVEQVRIGRGYLTAGVV